MGWVTMHVPDPNKLVVRRPPPLREGRDLDHHVSACSEGARACWGGGGGAAGPAFGPAPFLLGGGGGGGRGSKRSDLLFPAPQGEPTHGLHPRFVVTEILLKLSRTPVGALSLLHIQPRIHEASDLRREFRKNMVFYHPLTQTYPKSPFLGDSEIVQHTPTYGTTFFRNSACTGMHVQSVQLALPQNTLFLTRVLHSRGAAFRHIGELGPNSRSVEKPFLRAFRKGITYPPPFPDTIFREISRHCQNLH